MPPRSRSVLLVLLSVAFGFVNGLPEAYALGPGLLRVGALSLFNSTFNSVDDDRPRFRDSSARAECIGYRLRREMALTRRTRLNPPLTVSSSPADIARSNVVDFRSFRAFSLARGFLLSVDYSG